MRLTDWLLGVALGTLTGGLLLEAGVLVLLVVVPALIWSARERARPLGLAGWLIGLGLGVGGLLAWADARCSADPSCTIGTDPAPYFVFAVGLIGVGAVLTLIALRRSGSRPHAAS